MKKTLTMRWNIVLICSLIFFFAACQNKGPKSEEKTVEVNTDSLYLAKGQAIAGATFMALSGKLSAAIKSGGIPAALETCNLAAMSLTDSLAKIHQAQIKRTSLRTRNPANQPNEREREILEMYQDAFVNGQKMKAQTAVIDDNNIAFYAPIMMADLCLQCHGVVGETLTEENAAYILELYPNDQATAYKKGDLRGIWSISLAKQAK